MSKQQKSGLTILIVGASARRSRPLHLPAWSMHALRGLAALVLFGAGFAGFILQGELGLSGPHVTQLGMLQFTSEHYSLFMSVPRARPGLTPDEQRRVAARERARRLGLGDRRAASSLLVGVVEPAWRAEAERYMVAGDGQLQWPVANGWYGRGYGSGQGGYHLAIDINAERGTDVVAAASGIVGYAGRELSGFGNVIMLVHPNGLITLYGHNERNLVQPGQRVHRGQTIAALGSTGRSMGPHVHFELMYNGRNCDPMPLFAQGPGSYRNYVLTTPPMYWPAGGAKPEHLRCKRRMPHPHHDEEGGESESSPTLAAAAALPN